MSALDDMLLESMSALLADFWSISLGALESKVVNLDLLEVGRKVVSKILDSPF